MSSMASTRRQLIAEALRVAPLTAQDIARRFQVTVKTALDDLEHIRRGTRTGRFVMEPAECLSCSFAFRDRTRLETPSRCPQCRNEQIREPEFRIVVSEGR